jgi:electron transfer flavoprotein alpha/beta subunit
MGLVLMRRNQQYRAEARALTLVTNALGKGAGLPHYPRHIVLVLVDRLDLAVVRGLRYDETARAFEVDRELEGGLVEVLRVRCPALLTIQTGINEPRYATMRAIKQAREKPLDVVGLGDLGLDVEAVAQATASRTRALRHHEKGEGAEMLDGSAADVAGRIAEIVKEKMSG